MVGLNKMGRAVNHLLRPFGLRVTRVAPKQSASDAEASPLGRVVQCWVSDDGFIDYIRQRPKRTNAAQVQALEKLYFEGNNYFKYRPSFEPLVTFLGRAPLPKDFSLLDVGCAVGQLVPVLQEIGFTGPYVGIDVVEGFVSAASRGFGSASSQYRFMHFDALKMPFEDHAFDVVYSRSTLISTYDWQEALRQHLRVARKWVLLFQVPFHEGPPETIYFLQHSKAHTSLLCSFTQDAF